MGGSFDVGDRGGAVFSCCCLIQKCERGGMSMLQR